MALTLSDLRHLRSGLALAGALAGTGVAAALAVLHLADNEAAAHRLARAHRDEAEARAVRTERQVTGIHRNMGLFRDLMDRDRAVERRNAWTERIAEVRDKRGILALHYELEPRRPLDASLLPGGADGGFEFMASAMKLHMRLRHEEELIGFLADLGESVPAFLRVRGCDVIRAADHLDARCVLDWITLRERQ